MAPFRDALFAAKYKLRRRRGPNSRELDLIYTDAIGPRIYSIENLTPGNGVDYGVPAGRVLYDKNGQVVNEEAAGAVIDAFQEVVEAPVNS